MATIQVRERGDGSKAYTATIRIKRRGKIIHQESKTFSREALARDWARRREVELEEPGALQRAQVGELSLGDLLKWYVETFEEQSKWQRSKGSDLKRLQNEEIAKVAATELTAAALVDHVRLRRRDGVGPATALNDLVWIGVAMRAGKGARGLPLRPEVVSEARETCRQLRLVAKAKKRDRRPTADELRRLDEYFQRRDLRAKIPMTDIMWFAIHSARREAEICRIEWADNDAATLTGLVRDAKHPQQKDGNHRRFKYTRQGWEIVLRQPRPERPPGEPGYIFPFNPKSVSDAFTDATKILGIKDLKFHDLRHEATSRLFEAGYQIHEVAQFTLHESWTELKRYAQLDPAKVILR